MAISPYKNTTAGKAFAKEMETALEKINKKYDSKMIMNDWILEHFDCYRDHITGNRLLHSYCGIDTQTKTIAIAVLKKTKDDFIPPPEFNQVTYGQFYDETH